MDVTVELKPHVATQQTDLGPVEVSLNQFCVFAKTMFTEKPIHIGYIGVQDGAPFNGLHTFRKLPEALKTVIVDKIKEARADPNLKVYEPLPPPAPDEEVGE